jgi:hypothetical protein
MPSIDDPTTRRRYRLASLASLPDTKFINQSYAISPDLIDSMERTWNLNRHLSAVTQDSRPAVLLGAGKGEYRQREIVKAAYRVILQRL